MTLRTLLATLISHAVQPSRDTLPDSGETLLNSSTSDDLPQVESEAQELARLREENATLRRHKLEYFKQIRVFELERDQWRDLFHSQASEHANAQELLTQRATMYQTVAIRAIAEINSKREEGKKVDLPSWIRSMPEVRLAAEYRDRMSRYRDEALKYFDGLPSAVEEELAGVMQ